MQTTAIQRMLQNIGLAAVPGEILEVVPGDTVRVHLSAAYRGPAVDGAIYVAFGKSNLTFDEVFYNQVAIST